MLILMGVLDGARFLEPQLKSLLSSGCHQWTLWASDDGSSDNSVAILKDFGKFQAPEGCRVVIRQGPQRGFAANYIDMIQNLPDVHGPVALADQDDIWLPQRLRRATGMLNRIPPHVPALVCGRRINWGPGDDRMKLSSLPCGQASFANALVENVAFGNTIVLNKAAAQLARRASATAEGIYSHDWWLYQLLTGAGAVCMVDAEPSVLYRQHDSNAIGARRGTGEWMRRKILVLRGLYASRIAAQLQALQRGAEFLLPENRALLERFMDARQAPLNKRVVGMKAAGVYRQSYQGSIGFWGAVALGKV